MEIILGLIILVLSLGLLYSLYNNKNLQKVNDKLLSNNNKLKKELSKSIEETEEILSIDIGDRAILPNYGLVYKDKDKHFKVTYEVEIVEVSEERVKVSAISFTSSDSVANEASSKSGIIAYMQNKWIEKKEIELLIDESTRRDAKLRQLGIE